MNGNDHEPTFQDKVSVAPASDNWRREKVYMPAQVRPLIERLTREMHALGYPRKDAFAVRLALEEALVNALRHGHGGDRTKCVRISYQVTGQQVTMGVLDEGPGFDSSQVPDPLAEDNVGRPCGHGLFLMRAYMTSVRFNALGNGVTLCRRRSTP
jgi:serine/threonine-protein kinase RsbW